MPRLVRAMAIGLIAWMGGCATAYQDPPGTGMLDAPPDTTEQGDDSGPLIEPAEIAESQLWIAVETPFCCEPLERVFEARLDPEGISANHQCLWAFGDGRRARGCAVRYRFPWATLFTTTLILTLPSGDTMYAEVALDLGQGNTAAPPSERPPGERPPDLLSVSAGPDRAVEPGELVQLDAVATASSTKHDVIFTWEVLAGPPLILEGVFDSKAQFVVPDVLDGTVIAVSVTATAGTVAAEDVVKFTVQRTGAVRADDPRFGLDLADATSAIQRAIDSGAPAVVVPNIGRDWIVRPIALRSGVQLVLEPGVVLRAKSGAYQGQTDSVLSLKDVRDVSIVGYGATIRMRKEDYPSYAVKSEWRHGVCVQGATHVEISGLTVENTGGDGIYIGMTWDARRVPSRHVTLRDCTINGAYRNGISITSAEHLLVERCTVMNAVGVPPQAGIDVEPSNIRDRLVDILIRDCVASSNKGSGLIASVDSLDSSSEPVSVLFQNCQSVNSYNPGIRVTSGADAAPRGVVEFRDCSTADSFYSGLWSRWEVSAATELKFNRCIWRNVARNKYVSPIDLRLARTLAGDGGGIRFTDATIVDTMERAPFTIGEADDDAIFGEVSGTVHVVNPAAGRTDTSAPERAPELLLLHRLSE